MDTQQVANTAGRDDAGEARIADRWLLPARIGWVVLVGITLLLDAFAIPPVHAQLLVPCPSADCLTDNWQLTNAQVAALHTVGFSQQLAQRTYALDPRAVTRRFFEEATTSFEAGGALYLDHGHNGSAPITYATQGWQDSQAQITVPVQAGERQVGTLLLGRRAEGRTYREKDAQALQEVAGQIATAIQQVTE
jgi:GAF domain-containing protein